MTLAYTPHDWYWHADDGRLFGSAACGPVKASDPDFIAWRELGGIPTVWPRDAAGEQTLAALAAVLAPHGILIDLRAYATQVRTARVEAGIEVGGERIKTDRESQALIAGAHALALADPDEPIDFKSGTGWVRIDSVGMNLIALAVGRHVRDCFRRGRVVEDAIAAGTITTRAEIDAAFAS